MMDVPQTVRERFVAELRHAPSLDENGYICTKDEAIKAFDRAALALSPSSEGSADVQEAIRLLNKIVDLAYDEDVGEPLDDAIGYAKEALAALSLSRPDRGVWQQKCPETGEPCDCFKVELCKLSSHHQSPQETEHG